jgi:hypothetical protein
MLDKFKDIEPLTVRDLIFVNRFVGHLVVLRVCSFKVGEVQYRDWIRSLDRMMSLR